MSSAASRTPCATASTRGGRAGPSWIGTCRGCRAAVQVQGTLNDASDIDEGWTAEIAFPWSGLKRLAGSRPVPPRDGDVWRMDFSRFELLESCGVTVEPHPGWALNKHGVYDSHIPECFSFVHFSGLRAGKLPDGVKPTFCGKR